MSFLIDDEETNALVREVARRRGQEVAVTIKAVFDEELQREDARPLREKIRRLQEKVRSYPPTGLEADKAFYDSLNDEED